jgi:hypothetical protein
MHKAFLIHVGSALEAIKRKGYFKAYVESNEVYTEQCGVIKQVKAQLAKLDDSTGREARSSRKSNMKSNVATAVACPADPAPQADILSEITQAQEAADKANAKEEQAAANMFQFYVNLLSVNAKYVWNKISHKQTASNPYTDLKGSSKRRPRSLSHKSLDDCLMFHLLTVLTNNVAEQERYFIMNVLKKPQHVSICQFVQCFEQLNSYIAQLSCWYYSPSAKPSRIPMNVPFAKADWCKAHKLYHTYLLVVRSALSQAYWPYSMSLGH